jgi:hypothetical protein
MLFQEKLVWAVLIAFLAGGLTYGIWLAIDERAQEAQAAARCAGAGMEYSRQTHHRGKLGSVSWGYCIDPHGFIKEIPEAP